MGANLHFCGDDEDEEYTEKSGKKTVPLIDMINARLALLEMPDKHLCIDEMMVPTRSKFGPRVFQKGKPHPWGYKLFSLADRLGVGHNIHMHTGKFPEVSPFPNLGSTCNRVFSLTEHVPRNQGYTIYMDSYFTSIPLMAELLELGIDSMGTINVTGAPGFSDVCIVDKDLKAKGDREFVEYLVDYDKIKYPGIRMIRWHDSKVFNFAHTSGSAAPTTTVQRWFRGPDKRCRRVEIEMPTVIGKYNKSMGGVDKMDSIIGMYPSKLKVKRWHMNIFWHSIDMTLGNAWLIYNHENKRINRTKAKSMSQYHFKRLLAQAWMAQNAEGTQRIRRPRRGSTPDLPRTGRQSSARRRSSLIPRSSRYDGMHHMPLPVCGKKIDKDVGGVVLLPI